MNESDVPHGPARVPRYQARLRAYSERIIRNIRRDGAEGGPAADLERELLESCEELERGEMDAVGFFLALKAIEYRVVAELGFGISELTWFVRYDLRQTPATDEEIGRLNEEFLAAPPGSTGLDPAIGPKITHVALTYWKQYTDAIFRATRRERQLSILLSLGLALSLLPLAASGLLYAAEANSGAFRALIHWLLASPVFHGMTFGFLGAVTSVTLAGGRGLAIRPFDDTYRFWSTIPRLLIGAVAGSLTPGFHALLVDTIRSGVLSEGFVRGPLLTLLAFASGFSDRLFFNRLIAATWKATGLGSPEPTPSREPKTPG